MTSSKLGAKATEFEKHLQEALATLQYIEEQRRLTKQRKKILSLIKERIKQLLEVKTPNEKHTQVLGEIHGQIDQLSWVDKKRIKAIQDHVSAAKEAALSSSPKQGEQDDIREDIQDIWDSDASLGLRLQELEDLVFQGDNNFRGAALALARLNDLSLEEQSMYAPEIASFALQFKSTLPVKKSKNKKLFLDIITGCVGLANLPQLQTEILAWVFKNVSNYSYRSTQDISKVLLALIPFRDSEETKKLVSKLIKQASLLPESTSDFIEASLLHGIYPQTKAVKESHRKEPNEVTELKKILSESGLDAVYDIRYFENIMGVRADFCIKRLGLVVQFSSPELEERNYSREYIDEARDATLREKGFEVIRLDFTPAGSQSYRWLQDQIMRAIQSRSTGNYPVRKTKLHRPTQAPRRKPSKKEKTALPDLSPKTLKNICISSGEDWQDGISHLIEYIRNTNNLRKLIDILYYFRFSSDYIIQKNPELVSEFVEHIFEKLSNLDFAKLRNGEISKVINALQAIPKNNPQVEEFLEKLIDFLQSNPEHCKGDQKILGSILWGIYPHRKLFVAQEIVQLLYERYIQNKINVLRDILLVRTIYMHGLELDKPEADFSGSSSPSENEKYVESKLSVEHPHLEFGCFIYGFELDIYDPVNKINIELDGSQHARGIYQRKDKYRDDFLLRQGIKVVRIKTPDYKVMSRSPKDQELILAQVKRSLGIAA